jgi:hypothetical protein
MPSRFPLVTTLPPYTRFLQYSFRKRMETSGGLMARTLPKSIDAVTAVGSELKAALFGTALSASFLWVATWVIILPQKPPLPDPGRTRTTFCSTDDAASTEEL